jgi:hypothetical protein
MLEATINILIGYRVAIGAQKLIFPLFDIHISTADSCKVAALFTIVSLIRSYCLRRLFKLVACLQDTAGRWTQKTISKLRKIRPEA